MKNTVKNISVTISSCLVMVGAFGQPVVEMNPIVINQTQPMLIQNNKNYEAITSAYSAIPSGIYRSGIIFLADQIERNVDINNKNRPTVVTSLSHLDNLNETSTFGRLVSEHLLHELLVRGWSVNDIRTTQDLIINPEGEFALSRDIKRLRSAMPAENVVAGSYSITGDGILLTVRVIDFSSGRILSSAETRFKIDSFIAGLIYKPRILPVVKLTN